MDNHFAIVRFKDGELYGFEVPLGIISPQAFIWERVTEDTDYAPEDVDFYYFWAVDGSVYKGDAYKQAQVGHLGSRHFNVQLSNGLYRFYTIPGHAENPLPWLEERVRADPELEATIVSHFEVNL